MRSYHYNQFSARAIDDPSSSSMEPVDVRMVWRHITKHCFTMPFKAITPLDDMPNMSPHPIDTNFPPQINGMKHYISINITDNFLDHPKLMNNMIQCMFLY